MDKLKRCYKEQIIPLIEDFSGEVSFSIKNINSNEIINHREGEIFPTASTIKMFILGAILDEVEKGKYNLNDLIEMKGEQQAGGTGVLKEFTAGTKYTIQDVGMAMTILSDNTATNMCIDLLGGVSKVNEYIEKFDLKHTRLFNRIDFEAIGTDVNNLAVATTEEFTQYLDLVLKDKVFSNDIKEVFLKIMSRQQDLTQFARYIPYNPYAEELNMEQSVGLANKTGTFTAVRCDVGVLKVDNEEVVFSIFTKDCKDDGFNIDNEGAVFIGNIGKEIYNCLVNKS